MTVNIPQFIYDRFDKLKNIDYELEWIVGYMDKKSPPMLLVARAYSRNSTGSFVVRSV